MTAVEDWTALRTRTRAEAEAAATVTADGVAYGALSGVDRVSTPEGHFFFRGDELALVYLPRTLVGGQDAAPLLADLGPGAELASRTEKSSVLHVWPERGLAASVDHEGRLELVEVFPLTTIDGYRARVYEDPGPFVK